MIIKWCLEKITILIKAWMIVSLSFYIILFIYQRAEITKSSILRIILTHSVARLNALLVTKIG